MNTEPESTAPPDPSPDLSRPSEATEQPLLPENNAAEANGSAHSNSRRKGNVARLPKAVRDKINVLIQDGVLYSGIIHPKSTAPLKRGEMISTVANNTCR